MMSKVKRMCHVVEEAASTLKSLHVSYLTSFLGVVDEGFKNVIFQLSNFLEWPR